MEEIKGNQTKIFGICIAIAGMSISMIALILVCTPVVVSDSEIPDITISDGNMTVEERSREAISYITNDGNLSWKNVYKVDAILYLNWSSIGGEEDYKYHTVVTMIVAISRDGDYCDIRCYEYDVGKSFSRELTHVYTVPGVSNESEINVRVSFDWYVYRVDGVGQRRSGSCRGDEFEITKIFEDPVMTEGSG